MIGVTFLPTMITGMKFFKMMTTGMKSLNEITPSQMLLRLLTTKNGVNNMTDSTNKRLPGIPDRTLAFIVLSAGGKIEKFLSEDGKALGATFWNLTQILGCS